MIKGEVKTGNTKTDYFRFGNGEKNLVILPGLGIQRINFSAKAVESAYACFKEDYTVTVFDRKDDMPKDYTVEAMADDTALAMNALNIKNADLFGASMGGMIAQYVAIKYPEIVHSMILASTLSRPNGRALEVMRSWTELAEAGDAPEAARQMIKLLYSEKLAGQLLQATGMMFSGVSRQDLDRFIIQARAINSFDVYDRLGEIKCPVFVIGVEGDKVLTAEASRETAGKLGCELYMYSSEYAHCVFDEAPDYKQRMMDFYSSID